MLSNLKEKISFLNWNGRFNSILDQNGQIEFLLTEKGDRLRDVLLSDLQKLNKVSGKISRSFFKTHSAKNKACYYIYVRQLKNINEKINEKASYCDAVYYYQRVLSEKSI